MTSIITKQTVEGMFSGWVFEDYTVRQPSGRYSLWTATGFLFFRDYQGGPLVNPLNLWERWVVWRELKKERRRRAIKNLLYVAERSKV